MEPLGYTLAGDGTLHIHVNGANKAVRPDASSYDGVMSAVREEDWELVVKLLTPLKEYEEKHDRFEVVHGVMYLTDDDGEKFPVPTVLGNEILRYAELDLDLERLLLFAKNLNENPSRSSVQQLYGWIKTTNLTLTADGHFIAYKRIREDWLDLHTGTMDNSIGKVVKMPRNQVDENPDDACSFGLHVATYDYAHSFRSGGHVVAVKVHPRDVVAVPNAEHKKMRTCEYLVLEESFAEIGRATYEEQDDFGPDLEDGEDWPGTQNPPAPNLVEDDKCEDCGHYEDDCVCDEEDNACDGCGYDLDYCECEDY